MSSLLRALFNGTSKHKKLSEEWASIREPVVEGVTFYCKYLGSTVVDEPKGEASTAEAIKRIIHAAKQKGRKPERVSVHVSLQGIRMSDTASSDTLLETSIYKISYCSADAHYDHVFAFIATSDNEICECHAFLCPKRKMAQAVTISIAQAFNLAYEYWKMAVESKNGEIYANEELPAEVKQLAPGGANHTPGIVQHQPSSQSSSPIPIRSDFGSSDTSSSGYQSSTQALLIDLDDSSDITTETKNNASLSKSIISKPWDAFEDFNEFNEGFSRLALRHAQKSPLPWTSPTGWAGIDDLAAFTDRPPASPTENGFWPLASSPPTSPLPANLSSGPWSMGQSPPDTWENFSSSPNTAFLHSCQSPPSHHMFSRFPESFAADESDDCSSSKLPNSAFKPEPTSSHDVDDSFNPRESLSDPFSPLTQEKEALGVSHSSPSTHSGCGTSHPAWSGDLFDGRKSSKVVCS
ncbi:numb-like protein isoform X1 [Penaeus vannamei]|uniref:numb-like protein isoform X1 n=1 Tax=Penaeus vannamei TaxID=6689 RepID=UPI000F66421D|nr:protein disabled-like [Penaeus vannamei]